MIGLVSTIADRPQTEYLQALNSVIMTATAVNPTQRFNSVRVFKEKLLQLTYCDGANLAPWGKLKKMDTKVYDKR
jgi:hypothetical protein